MSSIDHKYLVSGLLSAVCLKPAPKRTDTDHHVSMVAALANALPHPALQAIGVELEKMRERTPRGGLRWSPGSVKHLLDKAKARGPIQAGTADTSGEARAPKTGAA